MRSTNKKKSLNKSPTKLVVASWWMKRISSGGEAHMYKREYGYHFYAGRVATRLTIFREETPCVTLKFSMLASARSFQTRSFFFASLFPKLIYTAALCQVRRRCFYLRRHASWLYVLFICGGKTSEKYENRSWLISKNSYKNFIYYRSNSIERGTQKE